MEGLEVHHMKPRNKLGGDVTENLMTLCLGALRVACNKHKLSLNFLAEWEETIQTSLS